MNGTQVCLIPVVIEAVVAAKDEFNPGKEGHHELWQASGSLSEIGLGYRIVEWDVQEAGPGNNRWGQFSPHRG